jgi:hypothetical protein
MKPPGLFCWVGPPSQVYLTTNDSTAIMPMTKNSLTRPASTVNGTERNGPVPLPPGRERNQRHRWLNSRHFVRNPIRIASSNTG